MKLKINFSCFMLHASCFMLCFTLSGCGDVRDMRDEARLKPYEAGEFFADGRTALDPLEGTVARGSLKPDTPLYTGRRGAAYVNEYPFEITRAVLERGRERYDIYCAVCHGQTGYGDGMVPRRGYRQPRSFHTKRLRDMRRGEVFDVITQGRGGMPAYGHLIPAEDRWAITAYQEVLQASQYTPFRDVPVEDRVELREGAGKSAPPKESH